MGLAYQAIDHPESRHDRCDFWQRAVGREYAGFAEGREKKKR
jgi:hypothetical protein